MYSTASIFAVLGFILGLTGTLNDTFPQLPAHIDVSFQYVANALMGMIFYGIVGLIFGFLVFRLPVLGIELVGSGGIKKPIIGVIGLCIFSWVIYQTWLFVSIPK